MSAAPATEAHGDGETGEKGENRASRSHPTSSRYSDQGERQGKTATRTRLTENLIAPQRSSFFP